MAKVNVNQKTAEIPVEKATMDEQLEDILISMDEQNEYLKSIRGYVRLVVVFAILSMIFGFLVWLF
jgi:hypothetical protein